MSKNNPTPQQVEKDKILKEEQIKAEKGIKTTQEKTDLAAKKKDDAELGIAKKAEEYNKKVGEVTEKALKIRNEKNEKALDVVAESDKELKAAEERRLKILEDKKTNHKKNLSPEERREKGEEARKEAKKQLASGYRANNNSSDGEIAGISPSKSKKSLSSSGRLGPIHNKYGSKSELMGVLNEFVEESLKELSSGEKSIASQEASAEKDVIENVATTIATNALSSLVGAATTAATGQPVLGLATEVVAEVVAEAATNDDVNNLIFGNSDLKTEKTQEEGQEKLNRVTNFSENKLLSEQEEQSDDAKIEDAKSEQVTDPVIKPEPKPEQDPDLNPAIVAAEAAKVAMNDDVNKLIFENSDSKTKKTQEEVQEELKRVTNPPEKEQGDAAAKIEEVEPAIESKPKQELKQDPAIEPEPKQEPDLKQVIEPAIEPAIETDLATEQNPKQDQDPAIESKPKQEPKQELDLKQVIEPEPKSEQDPKQEDPIIPKKVINAGKKSFATNALDNAVISDFAKNFVSEIFTGTTNKIKPNQPTENKNKTENLEEDEIPSVFRFAKVPQEKENPKIIDDEEGKVASDVLHSVYNLIKEILGADSSNQDKLKSIRELSDNIEQGSLLAQFRDVVCAILADKDSGSAVIEVLKDSISLLDEIKSPQDVIGAIDKFLGNLNENEDVSKNHKELIEGFLKNCREEYSKALENLDPKEIPKVDLNQPLPVENTQELPNSAENGAKNVPETKNNVDPSEQGETDKFKEFSDQLLKDYGDKYKLNPKSAALEICRIIATAVIAGAIPGLGPILAAGFFMMTRNYGPEAKEKDMEEAKEIFEKANLRSSEAEKYIKEALKQSGRDIENDKDQELVNKNFQNNNKEEVNDVLNEIPEKKDDKEEEIPVNSDSKNDPKPLENKTEELTENKTEETASKVPPQPPLSEKDFSELQAATQALKDNISLQKQSPDKSENLPNPPVNKEGNGVKDRDGGEGRGG